MEKAGLDTEGRGAKIDKRSIRNLGCADDSIALAESSYGLE